MNEGIAQKVEILKKVYTSVFNELSRLQIEQKFLERQAQSYIENKLANQPTPEISIEIQKIIEEHDQDFEMLSDYVCHDEGVKLEEPSTFAFEDEGKKH